MNSINETQGRLGKTNLRCYAPKDNVQRSILNGFRYISAVNLWWHFFKKDFQRDTHREKDELIFRSLQMAATSGAGPGQSREPGALSSSHVPTGAQTTWATFCCFPWHISRELDQKRNSQDLSQCPCEC